MPCAQDISDLLGRYGGAAPRYTSYPSAVHFQDQFPAQDHERLLAIQPDDAHASIYIHIPFCRSLCSYCGCFTRVVHDDGPIQDYLALLEKEIFLAGAMSGKRLRAGHIHFGGGSPNLLQGRDIDRLLTLIDMNFNIEGDAEIALEADPRQMTRVKAQDYARAGINRISFGIQDFNAETQKAINRIQPFAQVASCVSWVRQAGIDKVNFDLIYGLPHQTPETLADNAFKAAALGADRVALFGYAHMPSLKTHQKNLEKYGLPGDQERYDQAEAARAVFLEEGYKEVGMDHFALPEDPLFLSVRQGGLHRNFQGYTDDRSKIFAGFGLSAISFFPGAYAQNTTSLKQYRESLDQGKLPTQKGLILDGEDELRAAVIEKLMCYLSVDVGEVCKMHSFAPSFLDPSIERLKSMEKDGLVETDGRVVTILPKGRYFMRAVCAYFDEYIEDAEERYAKAV